jgi:beta-glucosidase
MPWVSSVPAIVHAWYLGNACGDAIADVLFGKQNPSGKLSLSFPKAEEDIPSYGHFHSENGEVCLHLYVTIPNSDAEWCFVQLQLR